MKHEEHITWLSACPRCHEQDAWVVTKGSQDYLYQNDLVFCRGSGCTHEGTIEICDGDADVLWQEPQDAEICRLD